MPPDNDRKRKKKVDYEALNAPLMQIPGMKVDAVRALLDINVREIYELSGRAPEVLFEEAQMKNPDMGAEIILYFKMAVYFAETSEPDPSKLSVHAWS